MGSNSSTSNGRKEANAMTTVHEYKRSEAHRWTNEPPVKTEVATATRNFKKTNEDQSNNMIEIIRPVAFLNHSANTNRVISFNSTATWRAHFQASRQSDKLIVIFFSASWCGFCRYMSPILDDLATQYTDVEMHKIDVDELYEISREFRVTTMPTFLFIKRGIEVDKVIGTRHQDIRTKIEKYRA
ncbi:thioredoxin H2-like [Silene latifolia]|uniref:thioredoxin H2-like n=1 Tax=Silene latifolia TaxID=37657 RepID=UPI003D76ABD5